MRKDIDVLNVTVYQCNGNLTCFSVINSHFKISGSKSDVIVAPNLCPFKEKIIEELNAAKIQEKEILMKNKMAENDEKSDSDALALAKLVEDARNRARGYGPGLEESAKIAAFEKMESASLAKEFKKVKYFIHTYT